MQHKRLPLSLNLCAALPPFYLYTLICWYVPMGDLWSSESYPLSGVQKSGLHTAFLYLFLAPLKSGVWVELVFVLKRRLAS